MLRLLVRLLLLNDSDQNTPSCAFCALRPPKFSVPLVGRSLVTALRTDRGPSLVR